MSPLAEIIKEIQAKLYPQPHVRSERGATDEDLERWLSALRALQESHVVVPRDLLITLIGAAELQWLSQANVYPTGLITLAEARRLLHLPEQEHA